MQIFGLLATLRSSAEPTATGIIWTYTKDMSAYLSLWLRPQTLIFDLGNLVDSTYTGSFNATLTASFYVRKDPPVFADIILPISAQQSSKNGTSAFILPTDNAQHPIWNLSRLRLPRGLRPIYRGVLVLERPVLRLGHLPRHHRGIVSSGRSQSSSPGGSRRVSGAPLVGIDAFDLREFEIDISPFLPYLSDGKPHAFQIKVVGLQCCDATGSLELSDSVGSYWIVTGKIFLFAGATDTPTDRLPPTRYTPVPRVAASSSIGQDRNGINETLSYSVHVSRSIWIKSGGTYWYQRLDYTNDGLLTSHGLTQVNAQSTTGAFAAYLSPISGRRGPARNDLKFEYPITVNTTYGIFPDNSGIYIDASLSRGLDFFSNGRRDQSLFTLVAGPSALQTQQHGSAYYSSQTNKSVSAGDTIQDFWQGSEGSQYARNVEAVNGSVVRYSNRAVRMFEDEEHTEPSADPRPRVSDLGTSDVRSILGRGPGRPGGLLLF